MGSGPTVRVFLAGGVPEVMLHLRRLGLLSAGARTVLGRTWDDPNHMKFFNDGIVNFPYLSDGMWFLTQHKRWGLLKDHPDYLAVAKQINQIELYKQAASALKISVPKDPLRASKLLDGVVWDGKEPEKYADSFKVKANPGAA